MEDILTDSLANIQHDLNGLKRVKEYLKIVNAKPEKPCILTWRTIEAFNLILEACSSQSTPQTDAFDILLDIFNYFAVNNEETSVWNNFGFEIEVICVKILSEIGTSESFEELFVKFLKVLNGICGHNFNIWKALNRQILNFLINKTFSFSYLETIFQLYISILQKVDVIIVKNFAKQNLSLLKTFSTSIINLGDFETQVNAFKLIFSHVSDKNLMEDFFESNSKDNRNLFTELYFDDFETDCRIFLNSLNKNAVERKIFSIYCDIFYLEGCLIDPPVGKKGIWLDANKDSKRLSFRYLNMTANILNERIMYIQFSEVIAIKLENETALKRNYCLSIKTQNLNKNSGNNSGIYCTALERDNTRDDIEEFVNFLKDTVRGERKNKSKSKLSQTCDYILIDRNMFKNKNRSEIIRNKNEVQDSAVSSSIAVKKTDSKSDSFNLRENSTNVDKTSWNEKQFFQKVSSLSPIRRTNSTTHEMSPNSFVESLNKNLGLDSPEISRTFEDSIPTVEFLRKDGSSGKKGHKLFRSPEKIFSFPENAEDPNVTKLTEEKEKQPLQQETFATNVFHSPEKIKKKHTSKNRTKKLLESNSEDIFHSTTQNFSKKKPTLPKIKRKKKLKKVNNDETNRENKENVETNTKTRTELNLKENLNSLNLNQTSLLDPNGYAYQRWIQPTTSERSNFWLKKLRFLQKERNTSEQVFDFSEEEFEDKIKDKAKAQKFSKTKKKTMEKVEKVSGKKLPLDNIKCILKSKRWTAKVKKTQGLREGAKYNFDEGNQQENVFENENGVSAQNQNLFNDFPEDGSPNISSKKQDQPINASRNENHSSSNDFEKSSDSTSKFLNMSKSLHGGTNQPEKGIILANSENHSDDQRQSCESKNVELESFKSKKRERSEGESSISKFCLKKKFKIQVFQKPFLMIIQRRLQKVKDKAQCQTDEIIETINKATTQLMNHIQKKEKGEMISYLTKVEKVAHKLEEANDLEVCSQRVGKVLAYYEMGCSVQGFQTQVEYHFSDIRSALKDLTNNKTDVVRKMTMINDRLSKLIESEIERFLNLELKLRQNRLIGHISEAKESNENFFGKY